MGGRRGRSDWERGWERRDSVWRRQLWSYRGERRPGFYCCSCSSYCCWIRNHLVTIWWPISDNFETKGKPLFDQGLNTWRPLRVIFDVLASLDLKLSLGNSRFLSHLSFRNYNYVSVWISTYWVLNWNWFVGFSSSQIERCEIGMWDRFEVHK